MASRSNAFTAAMCSAMTLSSGLSPITSSFVIVVDRCRRHIPRSALPRREGQGPHFALTLRQREGGY